MTILPKASELFESRCTKHALIQLSQTSHQKFENGTACLHIFGVQHQKYQYDN